MEPTTPIGAPSSDTPDTSNTIPTGEPREGNTPSVRQRRPTAKTRPLAISPEIVTPTLERIVRRGDRPDRTYIRKRLPIREFRAQSEPGVIEATDTTLEPETRMGRAGQRVKRFLLGAPIATANQEQERLTKIKALAVLSSDAISSVAYGAEASLGILILAGVAALQYDLIIALLIALLMCIVGASYFQTIHAYPHGGGSYIVARDNLGDLPGLVAAAALLIDYVLTVSVSVSAGVDALVSAYGALASISVILGVAFILLIMVINLRGVRESGTVFAAPTYLFIGAFLLMIVVGVIHALTLHGGLFTPLPPAHPRDPGWGNLTTLTPLLLLTAFASGCSAMTGVEAISNGVPAFKRPEAHNAARTLIAMVTILVVLFLGSAYLAWRFGITPIPGQNPTVDAQIASLLFNGPFVWVFFLIQFSTTLILALAANTSFADFPRLASILARDGFMPRQFSFRGDRLAFSTGIVVLSALSIVLLVAFHGSTDALINLYALGVFTAFTLSQSGMVVRWWRKGHPKDGAEIDPADRGWARSMVINGLGAFATGVVTIVIMITKFDRGAWIVVLLVPLLVLLFVGVARHYKQVKVEIEQLAVPETGVLNHLAIVPVARLDKVAERSITYAQSLGLRVVAAHIITDQDDDANIREHWQAWLSERHEHEATPGDLDGATRSNGVNGPNGAKATVPLVARPDPELVIIRSPYRALVAPLLRYIGATRRVMREVNPETVITVILPEYIPEHWWERLLHNETAFRLKLALYAQPGVVVTNVPYHLGYERREREKKAREEK